jgi:hypothetical protein
MLKIKRGREMWRCFFEVSKSHHSPLVLIGAPAQGCSSPLICAGIKCSLWADSLTLCHGESSSTAHTITWVTHKLRRMITKLSITTEPSRWWWSPRVTNTNSHLTKTSLMRKGGCTLATLYALMRSLIFDYQISITLLDSCSALHFKVFP